MAAAAALDVDLASERASEAWVASSSSPCSVFDLSSSSARLTAASAACSSISFSLTAPSVRMPTAVAVISAKPSPMARTCDLALLGDVQFAGASAR